MEWFCEGKENMITKPKKSKMTLLFVLLVGIFILFLFVKCTGGGGNIGKRIIQSHSQSFDNSNSVFMYWTESRVLLDSTLACYGSGVVKWIPHVDQSH